jgi:putative ABC transport system permease protein
MVSLLTPSRAEPKKLSDLSALRMAHAPGQSGIALAGIVASFSLVIAMAVMVQSFRNSLDTWLDSVLPAPLYMRVKAGDSVSISPELQKRLQSARSIEKAEFWSSSPVVISPELSAPTLIARPVNKNKVSDRLPLVSETMTEPPSGSIPVWVSEAMVDIYGWKQGSQQQLNMAGFEHQPLYVAGIWRDYARQQGAIVMNMEDFQLRTGKQGVTEAAFWPAKGYTAQAAISEIKDTIGPTAWATRTEFSEPGEIRKISLEIFDRSFAVTYLLEATAIVIGLFGVAATFAATAMSRRREFASLMALGARRRDAVGLLMREGIWVSGIGAAVGLVLGVFFSFVLIKVVNPQSFHWSMDIHFPYGLISALIAGLMVSSTLTAALTAWYSLNQTPVSILKEDWA